MPACHLPALLAGLSLPNGVQPPPALRGADVEAPPPPGATWPGRPTSAGYDDWDDLPIRCHWDRASYESYCDDAHGYMRDVWSVQVDTLDWPEPYGDDGWGGDDRLDIYFSQEAFWGAYTICDYPDGWNFSDADPTDGQAGCAAHLVIDPRGLHGDLDGYLAHEFNHILQFAVDYNEPTLPPWEGAAVQAEEQTFPGRGSWDLYGRDYQEAPYAGLLNDSYELDAEYRLYTYYEYGSALWFMHLASAAGIAATDLWYAGTEEGNANSTTVWDALWDLTGDADRYMLDFELARALVGTADAPVYYAGFERSVGVQDTLTSTGTPYEPEYGPYHLGTIYVEVEVEGELQLVVDSGHQSWGLVDVGARETRRLGADQCVVFEGPSTIGVTALGGEAFDSNRNYNTLIEAFSFTLTAAGAESCYEVEDPADTGEDSGGEDSGGEDTAGADTGGADTGSEEKKPPRNRDDDEDDPGCGCAAAGPASLAWLALPLLAVRRRR